MVGTRGFTAHIIIMEEAAYMKTDLFAQVVAPAMGVNNTVILAISTPASDTNYYSRLMEYKKPDGTSLFNTIRIGLACDQCIEQGVSDTCQHELHKQPPWKSQTRMDILQSILSEDDFAREVMGLIRGGAEQVYTDLF